MTPEIRKEMDELGSAVMEALEEAAMAYEGDLEADLIAQTKQSAVDLVGKYQALLERLGPEDRLEVQRGLGLKIEKMKGMLSRL
ncbi:MAG: hypothetical protein HY590_03900 [Candidatus Omnitrophica bacterium]|nr:hypothetical protein [Candidatus Omnitrophota bacterium]